MKMKEGTDWTLMNFRCPKELHDYLKNQSKNNYLSMTDFLIQLNQNQCYKGCYTFYTE